MNGGLAAGLALALLASLALNTGYLLQHRASAGAPAPSIRRPLSALRTLASRPQWVGAIALSTAGWGLYIAALWLAPLSRVTAFLAGGLALLVPVARRLFGGEPAAGERACTVVMAAALVLLALGSEGGGPHRSYEPVALGAYAALTLALAALLAGAAAGTRHLEALAVTTGATYGLVDMFTKGVTGAVAAGGIVALFRSPLAYASALLTLAAFLVFQRAVQGARPVPVIAVSATSNHVVAIVGGILVFGDPLGATVGWSAVHATALAVVVGAAFVLASAEAKLFAGFEQRAHGAGRGTARRVP